MLWVDDVDITGKTVIQRRAMLESIVKPTPGIQLASFVESEGKALFDLTKTKGMEGIVAKRKDSVYRAGETQLRLAQDQVKATTGICGGRFRALSRFHAVPRSPLRSWAPEKGPTAIVALYLNRGVAPIQAGKPRLSRSLEI